MQLTRLEADRLRNLKAVDLRLEPGLTVLHGHNGHGKSSVLEAAYLLATGRSFRTRKLDELVSWNGGPLRVAGAVSSRRRAANLAVVADDAGRRLLVERTEKDLESYLGRLDVVDLTAGRMDVLKGGPVERRRFLDRGIVGLEPAFLRTLGEYRRVLQQRNALLRAAGQRGTAEVRRELAAWDERLVQAAGRLHRHRHGYAERLEARLGDTAAALFPAGARLRLRYQPSPGEACGKDPGLFEQTLAVVLEQRRARDLGLGFTGDGPHRDDALAELDGVDLRRFGSAGQLRAAMIAFKLAKLSLLREERGEAPLFLMDDFDSDLDEVRAGALVDHLREGGFQTLVATSKTALVDALRAPLARIRLVEGAAHPA